jgi:hypothetical protein
MSKSAIEHHPYIGPDYEKGIDGLKVAIVGYSHYSEPQNDSPGFTKWCIEQTLAGHWSPRFFTSVRNSFGFADHSEFWPKVAFFNYVPVMIGTAASKFARAERQHEDRANTRLLEIIGKHRPDLVFVFTRKTTMGALGLGFQPLPASYERFVGARCEVGGHESRIVRLRHTQGAKADQLRGAIRHVMAELNSELATV